MVSATKSLTRQQFEANKAGWTKSFFEGISQDGDGNYVPWMTYPAIEFLQSYLKKSHEVFEFGCGASTLFFCARVKKVVGLETNEKWLGIVNSLLQKSPNKGSNVVLNLITDGLTNPNYENFAKNSGQKFDLIVIDSLKRFNCAQNLISALKEDGIVILDDSERKNYRKIFEFFAANNFIQTDFVGIAPAQLRIKNTTIFSRQNLC